ncbi:MAG: NAD(P)H-hydrate epimerase, partial [bacterium]|nr:NAD(P)H-hydrate epimerase [Candidatus Kapabacteria bacterium]
MTNVYTTTQAQLIDSMAVDRYGIPSLVLMENAARGACDVLLELGVELGDANVAIACGRGNNGGDGLALARHLMIHGATVRCVLIEDRKTFSKDAAAQLAMV